jgi:hypothetical protein
MGSGGIGPGVLAGAVAFTCLVTVFILVITYIGYSSSTMNASARRFIITTIAIFFVFCIGVGGMMLFPGAFKNAYYFIKHLGHG